MVERINNTNLIVSQKYFNNTHIQSNAINPKTSVSFQSLTDTVELSTKQKIKNKFANLSILQKLGIISLAVAGIVAGLFVKNRTYVSRAQKIFENAFLKDFSREDTINLINKFKEISKIKDNKQYITELFNLGRKEYGLEKLNVKLKFADLPKGKMGCMNPLLELTVDTNAKRRNLVNIIFHELKHAKQNEMMYVSNPDKYIQTLFGRKDILNPLKQSKLYQQLMQNVPDNLSFEVYERFVMHTILDKYLPKSFFEKLGYGQTTVSPKHKEYIEKLFKANEKYDDSSWIKYYFNFLEKDARKAGEGISGITRYFPTNIK